MRIDVKVALLPGRVLVKIRDKDGPGKERREIDGLTSCCAKKYKAGELMFINFKYVKNL